MLPVVPLLEANMSSLLWVLNPEISEESKWQLVRSHRAELISKSDWTQANDVVLSLTERQDWQEYRQLLRDLPQTYATPDEVVWPEAPNG
jgi:hypothetical protein